MQYREEVDFYPNHSDDPIPPPKNARKHTHTEFQTDVREYTQAMLATFQHSKLRGELFWEDFIKAFRSELARCWTRPTIVECKDVLPQKGVFIDQTRDLPPADAIVDILHRTKHIEATKVSTKEAPKTRATSLPSLQGRRCIMRRESD